LKKNSDKAALNKPGATEQSPIPFERVVAQLLAAPPKPRKPTKKKPAN